VLARQTEELEADSFFVRFLAGIERKLAAADYALLLQLVPVAGAEKTLAAYERLAAGGRVDGFLLTDPELEDPRLHLLQAAGLPVVVAGRLEPGSPFPWVETDHDTGMVDVVEHLVSLGHQRIGCLGGAESYEHVQRRLSRWRDAIREAGLEPGPVVHTRGDTNAAAAALLDSQPTAVACTSDTLALALVAIARARGLSVPEDLSVTGFDDSVLAALSAPALTSVRVDYAEFGAAAAAALLARIDGGEPPAYEPSRPVLEMRASTAKPRGAVSMHR
jgi:DNA-binding LacI/PurR family transcriptional regulator